MHIAEEAEEVGASRAAPAPESLGLARILEPQRNLLLVRRDVARQTRGTLADLTAKLPVVEHKTRVTAADPEEEIADLVTFVPEGPGRRLLVADIARLVREHGTALGRRHLHATLWVVTTDACCKFHQDYTGIRLLCTYAGPGTELVRDEHADRRVLGRMDLSIAETNALVVDPAHIERARSFDVVVLKGAGHPGNDERGAVHRSPPIEALGLRRLVFKLDEHPCGC